MWGDLGDHCEEAVGVEVSTAYLGGGGEGRGRVREGRRENEMEGGGETG